jgi:hypothetical protein
VSWLQRKGFMDRGPYDLCNEKISLTDRARALLETRAQLDGETEPGLGYMQGKGASYPAEVAPE